MQWRGGTKFEGAIAHIDRPRDPRSSFTIKYDDGDLREYSNYTLSECSLCTVTFTRNMLTI